jgi:hypothetical protein
MQHRPKRQSPHLRTSSSTAYLPRPPQLPFRTLLKRRNDTIAASQLYELAQTPPQKHPQTNLSHSQVASQHTTGTPRPPVAIKDYVKTMGARPQARQAEAAAERRELGRREEEREGQKSTRSVVSTSQLIRKEAGEGKEVRTLEEVEKRVEALIA